MKQVWETKDGRELKIKDMETSHIKHCINILGKSLNCSNCFGIDAHGMVNDMDDGMINGMVDSYFIGEDYIEAFETELAKRKEVEKLWI